MFSLEFVCFFHMFCHDYRTDIVTTTMREVFAAVFALLVLVSGVSEEPVFLEEPLSAVVAENETAVFRCRVNSGAQTWAVNGTFTSTQLSPDIEEHMEAASDGGNFVETLTIVARSVYNGTTVQCFVFPANVNSSTTLLIQGPLAAVENLIPEPGNGFILFRWGAPFSLNLTNTEPDITYCVDIYHSTNERTELVDGVCDLTETSYSFTVNETRPCDRFTVVVTPVNGAGNGSASDPVNFVDAPDVEEAVVSEVEFIYGENDTVTTVMASIDLETIVHVCTVNVTINTTDGRDPEIGSVVELMENTGQSSYTIPLNDTVPDRIWSMDIELENSAGSSTTGQMHLSTYDVQDIRPVSDSPSGIEFNVKFATNSRALGCVVIVKSGSMEAVLVKYRNITSTSDQFTVTGLPPASYDMAGFDLEGSSGLPGRYSAVNEPLESRETGSQPLGVEGGVIAEAMLITPTNGDVCVDCTILAVDNATECVLIIHPTESLEEIETVVVMNGEEHCIPDPSSMEYSVASFGRLDSRIVSLSKAPSDGGPSASSLTGTVIVIAVAIIVTMFVGLAGMMLLRWRVKRIRGVTLHVPDTEKPTAPNKDTQLAAPLLVQAPPERPPPPPESENRIADDIGSPTPSVSSVDFSSEPTKQEPLYDTVKSPMDKNVTQKKSGTGSVYANTVPDKSIKAPPVQDTEVPYAEPAGYKSEGNLYSIPQLKAPTEKTNKPKDDLTVVYKTIDHIETAAIAKLLQPVRPVATSAPAALPLLTTALLYDALYEIRGAWKALAEQFKQSDNLIDEIDTNNERDEACLQQVLEFWFKNNDFQHTWSEVVTALEGIKQQALADSIRSTYVPPEGLPGSQPVSLPPSSLPRSSLLPPQQDPPLPQGPFAVSSPTAMEDEEAVLPPSRTPTSRRWSLLVGREREEVEQGLPRTQVWRSTSDVGDGRETKSTSLAHFKSPNVPQETEQDLPLSSHGL